MTIRGVLLDKDGTLVDYARTWVPINHDVARFAAGGDLGLAAELLALGGHDPRTDVVTPGSVLAAGSHEEVAEVFAARLRDRTPPRLGDEIERLFREGSARGAVLYDGIAAALDALAAQDLRLGIATNDSIGGLLASLGRHDDLLARFDFLAGCDSGYGTKPEPGMALAFCETCDLEPGEIAVVGDAIHDLAMGRRAGAGLLVGVLCGTSGRADLEGHADLVLADVTALPAALAARDGVH